MRYSREHATEAFFKEIHKLTEDHHEEVGNAHDLDPDFNLYLKIEEAGGLRVYTVRQGDTLKGYAVFFYAIDIHHKTVLRATQDLLYLDPSVRALNAMKFIKWCDAQLKEEGVQRVYHYVTVAKDFSKLLQRMGYKKNSELWDRSL